MDIIEVKVKIMQSLIPVIGHEQILRVGDKVNVYSFLTKKISYSGTLKSFYIDKGIYCVEIIDYTGVTHKGNFLRTIAKQYYNVCNWYR